MPNALYSAHNVLAPTAASAARGSKRGLYNPAVDLANGKNTPALNAMILGIIALVVNVALLPSLGAIIWGCVGLNRANRWVREGYPAVGRTRAICGIAMGSIGMIATLLFKGLLF